MSSDSQNLVSTFCIIFCPCHLSEFAVEFIFSLLFSAVCCLYLYVAVKYFHWVCMRYAFDLFVLTLLVRND